MCKSANANKEWEVIVGKGNLLSEAQANNKYALNSLGVKKKIPGAILAKSVEEVKEIVLVANKYKIPLYPISTGHNWGYGGATPVKDGCIILDLSPMNKIRDMDPDLGLVTVEPGVTQGQLSEYFEQNGYPFMVPTTGAGPTCSLVGNALERGYGPAPYIDHFGAVTAIEAVLPSGELYQPSLTQMGGKLIDKGHKWGVGPYLDGLFSQSNMGIVTSITLKLAKTPEELEIFMLDFESEKRMINSIEKIRDVLLTLGENISGIALLNAYRILALIEPYPDNTKNPNYVSPSDTLDLMCKKHGVLPWVATGAIYGEQEVTKAIKKVLKRKLGKVSKRIIFLNKKRITFLQAITAKLPFIQNSLISHKMSSLIKVFELFSGKPNEFTLQLPYWKMNNFSKNSEWLNPDRDGCGLLWFAPLIPLKASDIENYVSIVKSVCGKFNTEPMITLALLSACWLDSTVPILFNKDDQQSIKNAHDCYRSLFEECHKYGYLPYRLRSDFMQPYTGLDNTFWRLAEKIKLAVDPNNIIAPGRYQRI